MFLLTKAVCFSFTPGHIRKCARRADTAGWPPLYQVKGWEEMERKWSGRLLLLPLITAVLAFTVSAALPERLVPVGRTVGIRLESDGLVVVGFGEEHSPAQDAGLKIGDTIQRVNGETTANCEQFKTIAAAAGGEPLTLEVLRDGKTLEIVVEPEQNGETCRLGLMLRDGMAGIGTVTFYDPDTGLFGALGHGVNELRSMILLPLAYGEILPSQVVEVQKGEGGAPGILKGAFNVEERLGDVEANTCHGIFGMANEALSDAEPVPVAAPNEVHTGKAAILSNVQEDRVEEFSVEITKLFPAGQDMGRNLLLTITDPRLLQTTGGIVQGMSGSPILQDGKLIGAVTHVLVDNPTQGYGIFIDNMLESCPAYREAA